jgi:hypothetical protein
MCVQQIFTLKTYYQRVIELSGSAFIFLTFPWVIHFNVMRIFLQYNFLVSEDFLVGWFQPS